LQVLYLYLQSNNNETFIIAPQNAEANSETQIIAHRQK